MRGGQTQPGRVLYTFLQLIDKLILSVGILIECRQQIGHPFQVDQRNLKVQFVHWWKSASSWNNCMESLLLLSRLQRLPGMRLAELEGLQWKDFGGASLKIFRLSARLKTLKAKVAFQCCRFL